MNRRQLLGAGATLVASGAWAQTSNMGLPEAPIATDAKTQKPLVPQSGPDYNPVVTLNGWTLPYRMNGNIKFCIKDQGKGFDLNKIPDPTLPENKEKLNGRGVFLIRNLADHVDFKDNGATLEMTFSLQ